MPVSALVSVTLAPGTTAPDVSRTVPTTVAAVELGEGGRRAEQDGQEEQRTHTAARYA